MGPSLPCNQKPLRTHFPSASKAPCDLPSHLPGMTLPLSCDTHPLCLRANAWGCPLSEQGLYQYRYFLFSPALVIVTPVALKKQLASHLAHHSSSPCQEQLSAEQVCPACGVNSCELAIGVSLPGWALRRSRFTRCAPRAQGSLPLLSHVRT